MLDFRTPFHHLHSLFESGELGAHLHITGQAVADNCCTAARQLKSRRSTRFCAMALNFMGEKTRGKMRFNIVPRSFKSYKRCETTEGRSSHEFSKSDMPGEET